MKRGRDYYVGFMVETTHHPDMTPEQTRDFVIRYFQTAVEEALDAGLPITDHYAFQTFPRSRAERRAQRAASKGAG